MPTRPFGGKGWCWNPFPPSLYLILISLLNSSKMFALISPNKMTISSTDKRNYMSTLMGLLWALLHALLVDPTALRIPPSAPLCWKDKKKQKSMRLGLCVWRVLFRVSSASLLPSPNPTIFFFFIIIFLKSYSWKKPVILHKVSKQLNTWQFSFIPVCSSAHIAAFADPPFPHIACTLLTCQNLSEDAHLLLFGASLAFFFFLLCSFSFFVCLEYKNNRLHPPLLNWFC